MSTDFFRRVLELSESGQPFCTATVVKAEGSASARAGSRAIVGADGKLILGFIGGGCAEGMVASAAAEALADGRPRTVELELTDELGATGVPCGGRMEIFVEPHAPEAHLLVLGHGRIAEALVALGARCGFRVTVDDPQGTREAYPAAARLATDDPDYERIEVTPRTWVVVATHHQSDHLAIRRALDLGAQGISMIASVKRRGVVFGLLQEMGVSAERLAGIRSPAGFDLGGSEPEEIALSVLAEIVCARRGGSGRPLADVKLLRP
ncbi:MAG: XdhC family protein [Planctomycetes bacterium]|nr:XdhC family protein [Planctomycetota bacterium]